MQNIVASDNGDLVIGNFTFLLSVKVLNPATQCIATPLGHVYLLNTSMD